MKPILAIGLSLMPVISLSQDNISVVQGLISGAYPELAGARLHVMIIRSTPFATEWSRVNQTYVQVHEGEPVLDPKERESREWLGVSVLIDSFGQVTEMRSSGRYVHSAERKEVLAYLRRRGIRQLEAIGGELRRRGAKFGPDRQDAFIQHLNLSPLEPFVGSIVARRVNFLNAADAEGRATVTSVHWTAELETVASGGERRAYLLLFEPFDGRLVQLNRHASPARR